PQNDVTLKMPAFEWVHVQLHQQKGMISLSPPTICNSAKKIITTVNMGLMDGGTGMRPQHLKLWCCLIFQNHANLFQLTHLLKMEKKCPTCFR
ncbi:hypothetical protein, partial [Escherichia coli]|uniref:hypothetical protein n=1 Tax=Escherichia coli TaxID=562 RepID=UPI0034C5B31D